MLAVVVLYAAACRVMLAPIFNFAHIGSAIYGGDARLIAWTLAWDNHALLDRVRPFFDANIFYPAPNALAYSEHLVGISVFTLPIYWLTRNPVLGYNIVWLASYLLAALGAHLLAWRYTRDHAASAMAGMAFAFCFFRMHHGHGHLHVVWAFWIPLSLVAMDRWLASPTWRRTLLFVGIITLQALASWYQAVLIFVADALFLAWAVVAERRFARAEGRRRVVRFATQAAVGAAIALACVVPFARHYSVLSPTPPAEAATAAADIAGYLVPPENTFAGHWLLAHGVKGPRWIWGEQTVYLGWTLLLFGAIGIASSFRSHGTDTVRRSVGYFAALGCVSMAFAFGPSTGEIATGQWGWSPFGLLMHVPGVSLFRTPARFSELLTLALAVLAAAGCATLNRRWRRAGRAVTAAAIVLFLAESFVVDFPGGPPGPAPIPKLYRRLAMMPPGPVVSLPDYADTPDWYVEPDYEYFSTAHWHPIANGYSRAQPPGFRPLMDRLKTFPERSSVEAMRDTGIRYIVLHAAVMSNGSAIVESALHNGAFRLVGRSGPDYLFEFAGEMPR